MKRKRPKRKISPGLAKSPKMNKPHARNVRKMLEKAGKTLKSSKPNP